MKNEKSPVPPDASASPRNFAISQSCDLPRICRVCGGPAMPKECNSLESETEFLEKAKKYNAEHPLNAEEIKARWRAVYYG